MKEPCIRNMGRDGDLTIADWRKFFAANPTPYVYSNGNLDEELFQEKNIVAFISGVEFHDTYFTYDITAIKEHLVIDGTMFQDLSTTIEPVYGSIKRYGSPATNKIFGIEYTDRDSTK